AERILAQPLTGDPEAEAAAFVSAEKGVADAAAALSGARDIIAQGVADDADVRATLRARYETTGILESTVAPEHKDARSKFEDYYDYREKISTIPPHRFHAIRRGETEGVLRTKIVV